MTFKPSAMREVPSAVFPVQGNIEKLREVYDAFLGIYPLCYGYWKKYADMESKHGSPENAKLVYEKGLSAISNSIDLWLAYCNFLQGSNASPADIRR